MRLVPMLAIHKVVVSSFVLNPFLCEVRIDDGRAEDDFVITVLIEGVNCEICRIRIPMMRVIADVVESLSTFRRLISI